MTKMNISDQDEPMAGSSVAMSALEQRFMDTLGRVFDDGVVTDEERVALWTAVVTGGLETERVDRLLVEFLKEQFSHFSADGHLSDEELERLRLIVNVLGISSSHLPEEIRRVL